MPEYTYFCNKCNNKFSIVCSIKDYSDEMNCSICKSANTHRLYIEDLSTLNMSIRLSDSEIKTLGHLANRNAEKLSDDHKNHLYKKHNQYREEQSDKKLPDGMSRITKPNKKIKWT